MSAGLEIGPYRIVRELGRGGAGVVYQALLPGNDRPLALKLLHAGQTTPEAIARFGREALLLAQVRHPSVVRVIDLQRTARGDPYLVTELVPGEELGEVRKRTPLGWERCASLVRELADAVSAMHALGIVHRDLKPQNVILHEDGHPVLLDFGLARGSDEAERLTQSGAFLGTPAYVAPEQADSARSAGPGADVYSLGAVLYFLLCGRAPYAGSLAEILSKLLTGKPPEWPSVGDPTVPLELEGVCKRAMRLDPAARTPSAAALRDELDAYLRGEGVAEDERRALWPWALCAALVLAALAVALALRSATADVPTPSPSEAPSGTRDPGPTPDERAPPSLEDRLAVARCTTLARSGELLIDQPRREALAWALHYRNAHEPLWSEVHHSGSLGDSDAGRLVPPRATFPLAREALVTFGSRASPSGFDPAQAKAWHAYTGKKLTTLVAHVTSRPINLALKAGIVAPERVHLFTGVSSFNTWSAPKATGPPAGEWDGSDTRLTSLDGVLRGLESWTQGGRADDDKPVTAGCWRSDLKQFALGTGRGGDRQGKTYVFRLPYPVVAEVTDSRTDEVRRAACARVELRSGPVRALAFGEVPSGPLWVLGSHELYRWPEGEAVPHEVATTRAPWWDVHVDGSGQAWVAGSDGLTVFSPEGEQRGCYVIPNFVAVEGIEGLGADRALVVGTRARGAGAWASLSLPRDGSAPSVLQAALRDFAYADVALSEQYRLACLTRWDGEFEVWDLDALLPFAGLPQAEEPAPPQEVDATVVDQDAVQAAAARYRGQPYSAASAAIEPADRSQRAILRAVRDHNCEQPLWEDRHANLAPDSDRVPRACFLAGSTLITSGGRLAEGRLAPPRRWPALGGPPQTLGVEAEVCTCTLDPRTPTEPLLLRGLSADSQRLEGSPEPPQPWSAAWPAELLAAFDGDTKPLSLASLDPTLSDLILGVGPGGTPEGSYVLRVPLLALGPAFFCTQAGRPSAVDLASLPPRPALVPGGARLSPRLPHDDVPLRVARGTESVWILGARGLHRWSGDEVSLAIPIPEGTRWHDLLLLEGGQTLFVGGDDGLTVARAQSPDERHPIAQDLLDEVHALYLLPLGKQRLDEQRILLAGSRAGSAAWAVVRLYGYTAEVKFSHETDPGAPYVDFSASPDGRYACLLRGDGRFEVWDLQALGLKAFSND
ncbi:MAG: serine/threonine-protein kinase [Planctomycetota bacterium]